MLSLFAYVGRKENKERKRNRLEGYDYSESGAYFITICTNHRAKLLADIVGGGAFDAPKCCLTPTGKTVEKYVVSSNNIPGVHVDKYVIMPNHVHLLITVDGSDGPPRASAPTLAKIPRLVSTLKRFSNRDIGADIFQRSYYDHVIRCERDYMLCWRYIDTNPAKWQEDEYYKK